MKSKAILALVMCLALLLCGCSASSDYNDYYNSPGAGSDLSGSESGGSADSGVLSDRKLIRRISITAETEDMDVLLDGLNQRVASLGGYVESRDIYNGSAYSGGSNRSATLIIRIPAAQLDSFVQQVGENTNIVSTKEASDDVTLQYVDTESRLKVLRTEEERLLQFLEDAASVSEMLEVEKRLTQVQSEIESLTAQLKTYDNLVDYGTVTLNITEVEVYTPAEEPGFWQKIGDTFLRSLKGVGTLGRNLLVFFLGYSPYLALVAAIGGGVFLVVRTADRRAKKKAEKKDHAE